MAVRQLPLVEPERQAIVRFGPGQIALPVLGPRQEVEAVGREDRRSGSACPIEGDGLPPRDTFITLFIDGLNMPSGVVVWQRDRLAGIELMEELAWSSIMPWIRDTQRRSTT